jgi:hypothetical protein
LPVFWRILWQSWRIIWQRLYVLAVLGFSVFCRSFFEGAEVNEQQEKVLEKKWTIWDNKWSCKSLRECHH